MGQIHIHRPWNPVHHQDFKKTTLKSHFPRTTQSRDSCRKKPEQTTNIYDRSGIYQLECPTCNMRYIGQTRRPFRTRYHEHLRDFKYNNYKSKFAQHQKTTFNRQNGEHHERITLNGQRPDERNREILHIPGNKNEQPNKWQTDSPTKRYIRNYCPTRNPQRAPNCTRPPSRLPMPTLSNGTQSERKQTSVMCYAKHYKPIGQPPEPLRKLRNSK